MVKGPNWTGPSPLSDGYGPFVFVLGMGLGSKIFASLISGLSLD